MNGLILALTPLALTFLFLGCWLALYWSRRSGPNLVGLMDNPTPPAPPALPFPRRPSAETAKVEGLTLQEAEDLLDWLENNGFEQPELYCDECTSFAVEFRLDKSHGLPPGPHQPQSARRFSVG
jgi:hypothetical protein